MSFKAELDVDGKTWSIRRMYTNIHRATDKKGRPASTPGWDIYIMIDVTDENSLMNWMVDPSKQLDGKITLYKTDQDAKLKEISFKKAYCTYLADLFQSDESYTSCQIRIAGKDIHIGSASLEQNWPGS